MTSSDLHGSSNESVIKDLSGLNKGKRLLDPSERVPEILFGLIMALTFTCSIGIANSDKTEIRQLLIAAIGCNLAWGLVDATMYIITLLAEKNRSRLLLDFISNTSQTDKVNKYISDILPSVIAKIIGKDGLELLRNRLVSLPESSKNLSLTLRDFKRAFSVFLLVFISTFPVVIPFVFISNAQIALRTSNLVAIVMMFFCGWSLARYAGYNKWLMSFAMMALGIILVSLTVALGG
jgi:VIT1/CCC1 family predicted Fe2+/Mn2+ transporter